jgi:molybdopterin molybdotransferase
MQPETHLRILDFPDALALVLDHAGKLTARPAPERLALLATQGRTLAEAVAADRPQPPFDRSTRDGFATQAASVQQGAAAQVIGQVRAGEIWQGAALLPGQAVEVMTGAPIPAGADCVVMLEHVLDEEPSGLRRVHLAEGRSIHAGENVVPCGSEARAGEVLLPTGTRMGAAEIAIAAACGRATLQVFARPRIAVIATGDELVEVEDSPLPHQIRNSNSYALATQIAAAGAEAIRQPVAQDTCEALLASIRAARACDLLLLTGGVSMGKYDLVEAVLLELGAEFFFTGVRMQPGKPVVFGRLPGTADRPPQYFFGLPGNPVSTQVTFLLFAAPLLRALCGERQQQPRFVQATLAEPLRTKTGLTRFLPALLHYDLHTPTVRQVPWQGSGDQAANARANGYLVVPPDRETLAAGEPVTVLLQ